MRPDTDIEWEKWAQTQPFYSILVNPIFLKENWEENQHYFWNSGHHDIENLFTPPPETKNALEFGCGVGRMTKVMAGLCEQVVGLDVSPTMLKKAEELAKDVPNVSYRLSDDELSALNGELFDFIYSYIVFQHIPEDRGAAIFDNLISHCAPEGSIAIHVTYDVPAMDPLNPENTLPDMQMNSHPIEALLKSVRDRLRPAELRLVPSEHGDGYHGYTIYAKSGM